MRLATRATTCSPPEGDVASSDPFVLLSDGHGTRAFRHICVWVYGSESVRGASATAELYK